MSIHGTSFQGSKGHGFLESVALERNAWTTRGLMSCGVGPGTVYENVFERAVHNFAPADDVHSTSISGSIAIGGPGAFGSDTVGGTGWARVFIRVKGVAHKIPVTDYEVQEGEANTDKIGAFMSISGPRIYSERRTKHRVTYIHSASIMETEMAKAGTIGLNLFDDLEDGFSDQTYNIDRIIGFSVQLPVTYQPDLPAFSWTGSVFPAGGLRYLYSGGTQPVGVAPFTSFAALGSPINFNQVCNNSLNSTDLLTGLAMFTDPTNRIQLQIQRIGFRPDTAPRREVYHDLA